MNRRQWLFGAGALLGASAIPATAGMLEGPGQEKGSVMGGAKPKDMPLPLAEYEPKSMLRVHETRVERSRYSLIDIHTHISFSRVAKNGVQLSPERQYLGTPQELLA